MSNAAGRGDDATRHDAQERLNEKSQQHDHASANADANNQHAENEKPADANTSGNNSDGGKKLRETVKENKDKLKQSKNESEENGPSGGYDTTPIPPRPAGYTIKITLHRAENLPVADLSGFSSDPYCLAQINTDTPNRHKEDPSLQWRTPTVHKTLEPVWNDEWIVANVPSSGFKLKVLVYDEDSTDHDDMLGRVQITVPSLHQGWQGIKSEGYKLRIRKSSKRAYLVQALTTCLRSDKHLRGHLYVSVEMLGRTREDGQKGRLYTVGPCRWTRHYSPLLGRLVNTKEPYIAEDGDTNGNSGGQQRKKQPKKKGTEHYDFQADQFQLEGPVPAELYHRYVEFKPWVTRMFTSKGISGFILGKALHHQHTRVYNYAKTTVWHKFPQGPSEEMTRQFLDLVHYDQKGRIFTYILTLDALWRFTETGKEFGIDMLSKHTMHSDVSIYIAFSGEFFIRRLKHPRRPPPPDPPEESSGSGPPQDMSREEHSPADLEADLTEDEAPKHPNYYELVIDNDSGTYRPNADTLPLLKRFLAHNLPGLHILTLDCNKDQEKQQRMKQEQHDRKKAEGDHIVYTQGDRSLSISSSDEEDLDRVHARVLDEGAVEEKQGTLSQAAKDAKLKNKAMLNKVKKDYLLQSVTPDASEEPASSKAAPSGSG